MYNHSSYFLKIIGLIVFFNLLLSIPLKSQNIREIAIHPCTDCSYEKQIYVLGDTAVYWYDWYYEVYYSYPNHGLLRHDGEVEINEVEAFEDDDGDSRLYVISDTAVFYYIGYYQEWYPLSTDGLNRVNGKPDLRSLQVFSDVDGDTRVYVVSNDSVMFYEWYYHQWYPLNNPVLSIGNSEIDEKESLQLNSYVQYEVLYVKISLPNGFDRNYSLSIVDANGRIIRRPMYSSHNKVSHTISVRGLKPGMYFLKFQSETLVKTKKFVVI